MESKEQSKFLKALYNKIKNYAQAVDKNLICVCKKHSGFENSGLLKSHALVYILSIRI